MYNHLLYLSYWLVNIVVLFSASKIPGSNVILGNWRFSSIESAIYAGFWATFIIWVFWDFAIARHFRLDKKLFVLIFFLCANFFAVWALSWFYVYIGFKQSNYLDVAAMAVAITILQRIVRRVVVRKSLYNTWF